MVDVSSVKDEKMGSREVAALPQGCPNKLCGGSRADILACQIARGNFDIALGNDATPQSGHIAMKVTRTDTATY